jgi:hypothetical protein
MIILELKNWRENVVQRPPPDATIDINNTLPH